MRVRRLENIATDVAELLACRPRDGTCSGQDFSIALSGGRTPWAMLGHLAERTDIEWSRVHVYQVYERVAPGGHPDRNLTQLDDAFLSHVPAISHPVPGDPVLDVVDRDVALTGHYQGRRRMTLTFAAINRAASIVWIVAGPDKGGTRTASG